MNAKPIFLAAAACAALSSSAHADTRVGIGAQYDFRDATGGPIVGALATDRLVVEAGASFARVTSDDGTNEHVIDVSLALLPVIARRDRVSLEVGLRGAVHHSTVDGPGGESAAGNLLVLTAPIRIDVAATRWLSVYAEAEVELAEHQAGETTSPLPVVGGGAYVAGFTLWF